MTAHFKEKKMRTCGHCGCTLNYLNFSDGCDGKCKERKEYNSIQEMRKDVKEINYTERKDSKLP